MSGLPLVTGATGFAGSHLVDHLLSTGAEVAAWGNPAGRPLPDDARDVHWTAVDLLDAAAVTEALSRLRPSAIFHCAGSPHVASSWALPTRALEINVLGTHHVLDALAELRHACPVVVVGSALVYRSSAAALSEDAPLGPSSPYALSKLAQEMLALHATRTPVYVTRPFNHAGPRQSDDFVTSSFARQIAEIEAGLAEPVLRVGNVEARRDITDVRDTVRAYKAVLDHGRAGRPYNVCSGHAHRIGDLIEKLVRISQTAIEVVADPARMRPSDNPLVLGDRARISAETGWTPAIPIDRTLEDILNYWRARIVTSTRPAP